MKDIKNSELNEKCKIIYDKQNSIKVDSLTIDSINKINKLNGEISILKSDINYMKNNYNTVLFEKMANQDNANSILKNNMTTSNIKIKYKEKEDYLNNKFKEIEKIKNTFSKNEKVKDFIQYIEENSINVLDNYESERKFYHLKRELLSILFLLPLVFFFLYRMRKNNIEEKYIQYIINKNVFIIVFLMSLFSISHIIYQYLPHKFISLIINFFYNLEIQFIAYYFLIGIGVYIFGKIIAKLYNKRDKSKINFVKLYNKGKCNNCEIRIDLTTMDFCHNCGEEFKCNCPHCKNKTLKGFTNCINCGKELE